MPPPRPRPAAQGIVAIKPHWAMAVGTLIICFPLGIFAVIYAARVKPSVASGNLAAAQKASSRLKVMFWISVVLALIIVGIVAGANSSGPSYQH